MLPCTYVYADRIAPIEDINIGNIYYYKLWRENQNGNREMATQYADLFLKTVDSTAIHPEIAELTDYLSDWYGIDKFQFSKAIDYRKRSLTIYEALGDETNIAVCNFEIALYYMKLEQYHKTLKYATEAKQHFLHTSDSSGLLECYNLLGIVYHTCRDTLKSIEFFQSYLNGAKRYNDTLKIINAMHNMALAYTDDSTKSVNLLKESMELCRQAGDSTRLCKIHLSIADMLLNKNALSEAGEHLNAALPMLRDMEDSGSYFYCEAKISSLENKKFQSISEMEQALSYFEQGDFESEIIRCLDILQSLYSAAGDYENAYRSQTRLMEIKAKHNPEYVFVELFKTENELRDLEVKEEIRQRRVKNTYIIFGCLLAAAIAISIITESLKKKSTNIKEQEAKLQKDNEILELKRLQQNNVNIFIEDLMRRLASFAKDTEDSALKIKIEQLCSELEIQKAEEFWQGLNKIVPEFNSAFYKKLIADFPNLTVNERRLCALLNMNLSTKEISEITRQTPHSINMARSRLRNKFNIAGGNESLQVFLSKYNTSSKN